MQMRLATVGPALAAGQIVLVGERPASLWGGELRPAILQMRMLAARLGPAGLLALR